METYVGELWRLPQDEDVRKAAEVIAAKVRAAAESMGYQVRSGHIVAE
ncbi:MAG: hypothetical protein PHG51_06325 [Candidatus Omnitrophica bacterium]|nr:hypothetical protein [Candidatus Omnitrophota bacterium]